MDSTMQIISNDQTVRTDTLQDLKGFISQSLATQAKIGEQLVSMMPATRKAFDLMGADIVELSTENDASKMGAYDEKWLEESKAKLFRQINKEKKANLIMSRMQKQMKKHKTNGMYFLKKLWEINLVTSFLNEINYKIWTLIT